MGSTGSLKCYQLSWFPKWKHFHTQVDRNGPQNSALPGDRCLWSPKQQHPWWWPVPTWDISLLWFCHCSVCYRSSAIGQVCHWQMQPAQHSFSKCLKSSYRPEHFGKKARGMSVVSWAWASPWLIALPQRNTIHRHRQLLSYPRRPTIF